MADRIKTREQASRAGLCMIGPFVEIRRDYTICFGSRVSLAGLAVWFVALFLTVDREQHDSDRSDGDGSFGVCGSQNKASTSFGSQSAMFFFGKGTGVSSTT